MKNFFLLLIFIASIQFSCCKCEPPPPLFFNLVVKNVVGEDLFNLSTTGAYSKDDIKLYIKSEKIKDSTFLEFVINNPVQTGKSKIGFYHLTSREITNYWWNAYNTRAETVFLQFRNEVPHKVMLRFDKAVSIMSLFIDDADVLKDEKMPRNNYLFYFTKK